MIPHGSFVWANFPLGNTPQARSQPGPYSHIAYCLGAYPGSDGPAGQLILAFTGSGPWRGRTSVRPSGIIEFTSAEAEKLNQSAFHIDLRCLARMLMSAAWLPDWEMPGHGIVATADAALRRRIMDDLKKVADRSASIIEYRGIGSDVVVHSGRSIRRS